MSNMEIRQKGEKNATNNLDSPSPLPICLEVLPHSYPQRAHSLFISFRSWLKHHFRKILSTHINSKCAPQHSISPILLYFLCYA